MMVERIVKQKNFEEGDRVILEHFVPYYFPDKDSHVLLEVLTGTIFKKHFRPDDGYYSVHLDRLVYFTENEQKTPIRVILESSANMDLNFDRPSLEETKYDNSSTEGSEVAY